MRDDMLLDTFQASAILMTNFGRLYCWFHISDAIAHQFFFGCIERLAKSRSMLRSSFLNMYCLTYNLELMSTVTEPTSYVSNPQKTAEEKEIKARFMSVLRYDWKADVVKLHNATQDTIGVVVSAF